MSISIDFNKQIAADKIISLLLALTLVVPFSIKTSQDILIVTSYGHFALAHWYQWKKGLPSKKYFLLFFAAFAGFWAFSFYVPIWPTVMVLGCFFFHCLWDEFKLTGDDNNILSGTLVITIVLTQVLWLLSSMGISTQNHLEIWLFATSTLLLLLCAWLYAKDKLRLNTTIILFGLTHITFIGLYANNLAFAAILVFRVLIHFHGISWYIESGRRYWKSDKKKFMIYLRDIAIVNTVFIGGYFIYRQAHETLWFLEYAFYSITGYYAWSMMHLITTFRATDYKNIISWPKIPAKA